MANERDHDREELDLGELSESMDRLNDLGYRVVWAQGMEQTGLLIRQHKLLLLDVTRSQEALADAIDETLAGLTRPVRHPLPR